MKIVSEISLVDFNAWSGAKETKDRIIQEGKVEGFDNYIEEMYPDGLTDTQLNDILWFDEENVFEAIGIKDEDTYPEYIGKYANFKGGTEEERDEEVERLETLWNEYDSQEGEEADNICEAIQNDIDELNDMSPE